MSKSDTSTTSIDLDPLLKDLSEKKQLFRKNVVTLAAELKDARHRLALQEESFAKETQTRQLAEKKAKDMEDEIRRLHQSLEEKNLQLLTYTSRAEENSKELEDIRSQLLLAQAFANENAASAKAAQLQCLTLMKELDEKNTLLKAHEDQVNQLGEQLNSLYRDLQQRENSQKQFKDEVLQIKMEIMDALAKIGASNDAELNKILEEVSPQSIKNINKRFATKDQEISRLRDEIRILSTHWKLKTKELESQLDKHRKIDIELKKRVIKLEFCLQEARSQTRKLQRVGERREKALKELKEELVKMKRQKRGSRMDKPNFWDKPSFKFLASMSMVVLVLFTKR